MGFRILTTTLLAALLATAALAQDARDRPERPKDPFATPRAIEDAARAPERGQPSMASALDLRVRGTLKLKGRAAAAVLRSGDRALLVRVGQSLALDSGVVKVLEIQDGRVTVEWRGRRLVLR